MRCPARIITMAQAQTKRLQWNGYTWRDTDEGEAECIPFVMFMRQKPQWASIVKRVLAASAIRRRVEWKIPRPISKKP